VEVRVILPRALIEFADGQREVLVDVPDGAVLGDAISDLSRRYPALARRIVDETGELRRFANVYVGAEECRRLKGLATPVPPGVDVSIIGSIAGG
jgi:molybdopterin synthase sulfur carrier subunit